MTAALFGFFSLVPEISIGTILYISVCQSAFSKPDFLFCLHALNFRFEPHVGNGLVDFIHLSHPDATDQGNKIILDPLSQQRLLKPSPSRNCNSSKFTTYILPTFQREMYK